VSRKKDRKRLTRESMALADAGYKSCPMFLHILILVSGPKRYIVLKVLADETSHFPCSPAWSRPAERNKTRQKQDSKTSRNTPSLSSCYGRRNGSLLLLLLLPLSLPSPFPCLHLLPSLRLTTRRFPFHSPTFGPHLRVPQNSCQ
jgi:hypothetical protein